MYPSYSVAQGDSGSLQGVGTIFHLGDFQDTGLIDTHVSPRTRPQPRRALSLPQPTNQTIAVSRLIAPATPWALGTADVMLNPPGACAVVMVAEWPPLKLSSIDMRPRVEERMWRDPN